MSKKFEGANITAMDVVSAYRTMGLGHLLGDGPTHTVIERDRGLTSESIELFFLPGKLRLADFMGLLMDAGLTKRNSPQAA
jgi:hypothetical protein